MDLNEHVIRILVEQRLAEARAAAARRRIARGLRRRRSLRMALGVGLIGLGSRLIGDERAFLQAPEGPPGA